MKIVWFSWKDIKHPQAGGAETVSWQIMRRLVRDGHQVKLITARPASASAVEMIDGVEILRHGNRFSVYPKSRQLFKKELSEWPDLIIDEMNTIPFMSAFYTRRNNILLTYQLARQIWFYQIALPVAIVGYLLEPLYLRLMSRYYKAVLTESESTRRDLQRYGFQPSQVKVFRVGIDLHPIERLGEQKDMDHVLVLGAMRPMKRTLDAVKGFEVARDERPALRLTIAGDNSGRYAKKVINHIRRSRHAEAITVCGKVSTQKKDRLMREASVILVTSVKEGWGLIVTEANSQGTPAVVYDTDGLRDSVHQNETGLIVRSGDIEALAESINRLLGDKQLYGRLREKAWQSSKQYTFDNSYHDFIAAACITN